MAKPFKLRYVNELAGTFVLAALVLVVGGVLLVGRAQKWFTPVRHLTLILPEDGSFGLQPGASILVLGTSAGSVNDITVSADGKMLADVRIRQDFMRFLRNDSVAVIRKTLGVGDAYVEITRGKGAPLAPVNPSIQAEADQGATQAISELTTAIRVEVVPTLKELRHSLQAYSQLADDLRNPTGPFQQSLAHLQAIAAGVDSGQGLAGHLLRNGQLSDDVETLLKKLNASADETQRMVAELRQTTGRMPKIADSVDEQIKQLSALTAQTKKTMEQAQAVLADMQRSTSQMPMTIKTINTTMQDLPALVMQASETFRQTQRLVEAMQRNWLISPYIGDAAPTRLSPGQAGGQ